MFAGETDGCAVKVAVKTAVWFGITVFTKPLLLVMVEAPPLELLLELELELLDEEELELKLELDDEELELLEELEEIDEELELEEPPKPEMPLMGPVPKPGTVCPLNNTYTS